jgi:hypothetical protein
VSRGGGVTTTGNEQVAARWRASVAVHVTVVEPTANDDPLDGVQFTTTGGAPALPSGVSYVTAVARPVRDVVVTGLGHAIRGGSANGSTGGGVG